jgi:hypothetical protein
MARGWESKSIEDQISEKESQTRRPANSTLTVAEALRREKRDSLLLARARTLTDLQSARDDRYRALLERTLEHLNARINEIDTAA